MPAEQGLGLELQTKQYDYEFLKHPDVSQAQHLVTWYQDILGHQGTGHSSPDTGTF